jgi:cell wall-associated NlpC family hydrolase/LysM repeat protein
MSFRVLAPGRAASAVASSKFSLGLSLSLAAVLCSAAKAESYHQVEAGETLSAVAARYSTTPEALRALNKLSFSETAALPTMLLRVPEEGARRSTVQARAITATPVANADANRAEGSIVSSVRYTVREGDTVASIAQSFGREGREVSAQSIRERNRIADEVSAGQSLVIPVSSTSYRSNAQTAHSPGIHSGTGTARLGAQRIGGAEVSEEFEWPVAQVVAPNDPSYRSPNTTAQASSSRRVAQAGRSRNTRGGSPRDYRMAPTSRGYSPGGRSIQYGTGGRLDGARVLGAGEEAANPSRGGNGVGGSHSRVVQAPVQAAPTGQKIARVARVSMQGAKIRRLPDAQAVALYACPTATEIAVIRQSGAWSAILMSDRSTGWMPSRYLRFTGASVDVSSIPLADTQYAGVRRSSNNRYAMAGNFSSSHPVVASALGWLGTRYVYGGTGRNGIDCSALVQNCSRANGIRLPRTAAEQARVGMRVNPSDLQAGDRLYFSASGSRVDHTGLYMGDGLFVHASGSGRSVIVSNLHDSRNWNIFVGARR